MENMHKTKITKNRKCETFYDYFMQKIAAIKTRTPIHDPCQCRIKLFHIP